MASLDLLYSLNYSMLVDQKIPPNSKPKQSSGLIDIPSYIAVHKDQGIVFIDEYVINFNFNFLTVVQQLVREHQQIDVKVNRSGTGARIFIICFSITSFIIYLHL